ncbi:restriction endonuclease subunit S [Flagellimonas marinaquae]|uniref:restriction endonuclease subunit S n=1 Tax=Flagellimonas marinaquae TaxID=254955 RepID=UPI002074B01B|nr:restriction endonuclease subunit S [Allomuricauda aquimarina]USD23832.1 restriction endonuclease subunit S [Allomuricauda aquimarina]
MNKLNDAVTYVKERMPREELKLETYITTDNLKQNKGGKENAISLPPSGNTFPAYSKNDILIGNIRPYLRKIWFADSSGGHSADVLNLRVNKGICPRFIYYNCFQNEFFDHMMKGSKGSKMPRGDKNQILTFPIPDYSYNYQQQIAKVLSDLDNKIEVNIKINMELEAMAKLIYDYWFVQFDFPNKNGKPYKSSGGKMVYNKELKLVIPEGWVVKPLTEEMDLQYGFPFSTKLFNEEENGVPVIRIRDIQNGSISYHSTEDVDEKYRLNKGDVLVGMDGNFHINYWNLENCYLNQRCLRIRSKSNSISEIQARYMIEPFIKAREKNVSRTTVGHLSAKDINDLKIIVAHPELQSKANKLFNSILKKIISSREENQRLGELRDWLLPMLMNGQIKVVQTEKDTLKELFPDVNLYAEVAALQFLDKKANSLSHGKTYIQKAMSHLKDIKREKRLKHIEFEEYHWGMFSKTVAKSIDSNPFLYQETTPNGKKVYKVKANKMKELITWMALQENQGFVKSVEELIALYQDPLIGNDIDRIELLNTVHRCMTKLNSDKLVDIRKGMQEWPMKENSYKNKAEKFTENETLLMIGFIKELLVK